MRILIAFSDTGGGHRAAANALRAAFSQIAPEADVAMVDPYAISRWPFNRLSGAYPRVIGKAAWIWGTGFRLTNSRWCTAVAQAAAWPILRPAFDAIRREHSPDVIISTHPLLSAPLQRAFPDVPLVVVVTDLLSGHVSWYHRTVRLLVAPTEQARAHAMASGVPADRTEVIGLPIMTPDPSMERRSDLVATLGWSTDRPTILLMGGGDGVGPMERIAEAIDAAQLPCDLAIVAGRNAVLATRLRAREWHGTVHTYGFVSNVHQMLHAADALITKAGPGTICEAFAAGCPVVLYAAIPGQETGNVRLVCESGAGVWAPTPDAVVNALRAWLTGPHAAEVRGRAANAAQALARPHAATDIAARVLEMAGASRY